MSPSTRVAVAVAFAVAVAATRGVAHAGGATAHSGTSGDLLANWMGQLAPVIGKQTVLDLALPITHDTMTYDLSTTVSEGGWDASSVIAWILHEFPTLTPGSWIRTEAHAQGINLTQQLNAGVRFIDFRVMYDNATSTAKQPGWRSLHFVQSNGFALDYLKSVRAWMDAHPTEFVLLWVSRHGGVCETGDTAYPGVSTEQKQAFFGQIKTVFDGLMFNTTMNRLNETTLDELITTNQRILLAMGDWSEFTGSDPMSMDACAMEHKSSSSSVEIAASANGTSYYASKYTSWMEQLQGGEAGLQAAKANNSIHSSWFDGDPPTDEQMLYAFLLKYIPLGQKSNLEKCVALYGIENMSWCPPGLLDNSQLQNYYLQLALDAAYRDNWTIPSVAVNALTPDGTIRVGGTALIDGVPMMNGNASSAFVDTLLCSNVRRACASVAAGNPQCGPLLTMLETRRSSNPVTMWSDAAHGRLPTLPSI